LQKVVELIASPVLGAARAPDLTVDLRQARLRRGFIACTPPDTRCAFDQGQLVIFLEKDHHAVRQLHAARFLGMKSGKRRDVDLAPIGHLRACPRHKAEQAGDRQSIDKVPPEDHCFASLPPAICVYWIMPMLRLESTNVWLATLRMSALVTLLIRSTTWKKDRQSAKRACPSANWCASPELSASKRSRSVLTRVFTIFSSSS